MTDEELKRMTDEELIQKKQENSGAWHTDPDNRPLYEAENKSVMGELDRRKGTASTFDPASGTWNVRAAQPDYTKVYSDPTPKPEYSGTWQKTTEDLTRQALGMSYGDWTQGEDYQALAGRYRDMGQLAMDDTVGRVAARTGGLASSYAASAGQQQYNQYLSQLEQVARQMYAAQRGDAVQNAQLAGTMADREYGQYLDRLGQYNTDRAFNYGVYRDQVGDSQWQQNFDYRAARDQVGDSQWQQSFDRGVFESDRDYDYRMDQTRWQREQQEREEARAQLDAMLKSGRYQAWELPWELVERAGYDPHTWQALEKQYADQRQAQTASRSSSSGSSGKSGSKSSGKSGSTLGRTSQWTLAGQMGTQYNAIFENTKYMSRAGLSDKEIMDYLDGFTKEQLTDEGLESIMYGLDLAGIRTQGD